MAITTSRNIQRQGWSLPYRPRPQMLRYHARTQMYAYLICHRRYGKTVACIAELITRALYSRRHRPQYAYVAPFRSQAKAVAWNYLKDMTQGIAANVSVSDLQVTLPNGATITLTGSDNPNALRGNYFDGVIIDEFAQCRPTLLEEVVMPCLLDRNGWLTLIGTAYGRLNQFFKFYEKSRDDPDWFHADIKITESNVFTPEQIKRIQSAQSEAKFRQEFMNDFSAELTGTYYASIINQLEQNNRLIDTSDPLNDTLYQPQLKTHVAFDIGRKDSTVAWFWQETPDGLRIVDMYENSGQQAQHYIDQLTHHPRAYDYGNIWLPHDAVAKTFATDKSAIEQFINAQNQKQFGPDAHIQKTPQLSRADGIEAVRITLPQCYFDYTRCYTGVEALRVYRKKWDEVHQCFSEQPLHDYSSDFSDSFRYLSIVANTTKGTNIYDLEQRHRNGVGRIITRNGQPDAYNATMDEMFRDRERNINSRSAMRI